MFGIENLYHFITEDVGANTSERERRMSILNKIAGIMKVNGLFIITNISPRGHRSGYWNISDEKAGELNKLEEIA